MPVLLWLLAVTVGVVLMLTFFGVFGT